MGPIKTLRSEISPPPKIHPIWGAQTSLLAWHGIGNEVGNRGHGQRSEGSGPPLPAEAPGQTEASPEFDLGRKGCNTKVIDKKYPEPEQLRNDTYSHLGSFSIISGSLSVPRGAVKKWDYVGISPQISDPPKPPFDNSLFKEIIG